MAVISQIKGTDNVTYNVRDDVSIWGGRNYATLNFTGDWLKTGTWGLTDIDKIDTSLSFRGRPVIKRYRTEQTADSWREFQIWVNNISPSDAYWTLSCWVYSTDLTWTKNSNNINTSGLRCYKKSELVTPGIRIAGTYKFFPSTTNIWQKVYSTFKIPPNNDYDKLYVYITSNRAINMYMTDIKLEKGSKPTDWSPAPKDIAHVNGEQLELLS